EFPCVWLNWAKAVSSVQCAVSSRKRTVSSGLTLGSKRQVLTAHCTLHTAHFVLLPANCLLLTLPPTLSSRTPRGWRSNIAASRFAHRNTTTLKQLLHGNLDGRALDSQIRHTFAAFTIQALVPLL